MNGFCLKTCPPSLSFCVRLKWCFKLMFKITNQIEQCSVSCNFVTRSVLYYLVKINLCFLPTEWKRIHPKIIPFISISCLFRTKAQELTNMVKYSSQWVVVWRKSTGEITRLGKSCKLNVLTNLSNQFEYIKLECGPNNIIFCMIFQA